MNKCIIQSQWLCGVDIRSISHNNTVKHNAWPCLNHILKHVWTQTVLWGGETPLLCSCSVGGAYPKRPFLFLGEQVRTQSCRLMRMSLFFFFVHLFFSVTHSSRGRHKEFGILIMRSVFKGLKSWEEDQLSCVIMIMSIYKKTRRSVCGKAECNSCFTWLSWTVSWASLTISHWLQFSNWLPPLLA